MSVIELQTLRKERCIRCSMDLSFEVSKRKKGPFYKRFKNS